MKKSIILLIISIVALCIPMQAQHLKFMDIPLTGTITQFQNKLAAKGVKYDKSLSQELPAGTRAFKGTFAGEKADIYIYYDPTTKIVHRAKAVMTYSLESTRESKYEEFKYMLSSKYNAFEQSEYEDGHEVNNYVIAKDGATSIDDIIGYISIYVTDYSLIYDNYLLHIEYADHQNSKKSEESKMKDL